MGRWGDGAIRWDMLGRTSSGRLERKQARILGIARLAVLLARAVGGRARHEILHAVLAHAVFGGPEGIAGQGAAVALAIVVSRLEHCQ